MKFYYVIDIAKKIIDADGQVASGDSINTFHAKTEKQAKKIALKWLKDEKIWSVWILKLREDYNGDPYYQWGRYKDDKDWRCTDCWIND